MIIAGCAGRRFVAVLAAAWATITDRQGVFRLGERCLCSSCCAAAASRNAGAKGRAASRELDRALPAAPNDLCPRGRRRKAKVRSVATGRRRRDPRQARRAVPADGIVSKATTPTGALAGEKPSVPNGPGAAITGSLVVVARRACHADRRAHPSAAIRQLIAPPPKKPRVVQQAIKYRRPSSSPAGAGLRTAGWWWWHDPDRPGPQFGAGELPLRAAVAFHAGRPHGGHRRAGADGCPGHPQPCHRSAGAPSISFSTRPAFCSPAARCASRPSTTCSTPIPKNRGARLAAGLEQVPDAAIARPVPGGGRRRAAAEILRAGITATTGQGCRRTSSTARHYRIGRLAFVELSARRAPMCCWTMSARRTVIALGTRPPAGWLVSRSDGLREDCPALRPPARNRGSRCRSSAATPHRRSRLGRRLGVSRAGRHDARR